MNLRDYPRPKNDTGIGVHWSAGFASVVGMGQIEEFWIPELIALGVKWVKVANYDGAMSFVEALLRHDIMPIIRLYRFRPNPNTLNERELRAVGDYVAAGARYFEFNNEPDLGIEWQSGEVPPDAPAIVAKNAITDMEAILKRGGYPAVPALAPGTRWDLVSEICQQGGRHLFNEPVWQAVHNYGINHPLDYPDDAVNQKGAPVSPELYELLAQETWDSWQGWDMAKLNEVRRTCANPGATILDDASCWRAYERYNALARKQLGHSLPILATEGGYIVGERQDPRYPTTTLGLHTEQTLEACRMMMGTPKYYKPAPDYYFCTAFWVLGNYVLGHYDPMWEDAAWYGFRRAGGQLPIVAALKAEPKQARVWQGESDESAAVGRIEGVIAGGEGVTVRLERADGWFAVTSPGAGGKYVLAHVPYGDYTIRLVEADIAEVVSLSATRPSVTFSHDLSAVSLAVFDSALRGVVRGGAGMSVRLTRTGSDYTQEQALGPFGGFMFDKLRGGSYILALLGTDVAETVELNGRDEKEVTLQAPGWGWTATDGGPGPGFGVIRCRVAGRPGMAVRVSAPGWEGFARDTGSKAEYGGDACELAPLSAGDYTVEPDGLGVSAHVTLDGSRVTWVIFTNDFLTEG